MLMLSSFKIEMITLRQPIPAESFLNAALACQKANESLVSLLYPNASSLFKLAMVQYAAIKIAEYEIEEWKKKEAKIKK